MDTGKIIPGSSLPLLPVKSVTRTDLAATPDAVRQPSDVTPTVASEEGLKSAVAELRSIVQQVQRNLDFSIDKSTGDVVVKVIDGESGKVVRQFPSEELLRLSEQLEDMRSLMQGTKA